MELSCILEKTLENDVNGNVLSWDLAFKLVLLPECNNLKSVLSEDSVISLVILDVSSLGFLFSSFLQIAQI